MKSNITILHKDGKFAITGLSSIGAARLCTALIIDASCGDPIRAMAMEELITRAASYPPELAEDLVTKMFDREKLADPFHSVTGTRETYELAILLTKAFRFSNTTPANQE